MKRWLAPGVALLAMLWAGCSSPELDPGDAVDTDSVAVRDNHFAPAIVEIAPGETVTWTWEGQLPHDVAGEGFVSAIITSGTFSHRFDEAGTYEYVCTLHKGMDGLIVVRD